MRDEKRKKGESERERKRQRKKEKMRLVSEGEQNENAMKWHRPFVPWRALTLITEERSWANSCKSLDAGQMDHLDGH